MENQIFDNPQEGQEQENIVHLSDVRTDLKSVGSAIQEVTQSFVDVIRSEIKLAKAEAKELGTHVGSHIARASIFGVVAILGVLPFIAFLVIGLGRILNDNYWLSSLIVSIVMIGVGGALAYFTIQKMTERDLTLPKTRRSVEQEVNSVNSKVSELKDVTKRRSA